MVGSLFTPGGYEGWGGEIYFGVQECIDSEILNTLFLTIGELISVTRLSVLAE